MQKVPGALPALHGIGLTRIAVFMPSPVPESHAGHGQGKETQERSLELCGGRRSGLSPVNASGHSCEWVVTARMQRHLANAPSPRGHDPQPCARSLRLPRRCRLPISQGRRNKPLDPSPLGSPFSGRPPVRTQPEQTNWPQPRQKRRGRPIPIAARRPQAPGELTGMRPPQELLRTRQSQPRH
jgi:hypothetical protein